MWKRGRCASQVRTLDVVGGVIVHDQVDIQFGRN